MDEDEILNREGLTPQEYLEFTERFVPENETVPAKTETVRLASKSGAVFSALILSMTQYVNCIATSSQRPVFLKKRVGVSLRLWKSLRLRSVARRRQLRA
jgi:hypothetical protein